MKKIYADKSIRNRRRQWKLKHLDVEDVGSVNSTIERFVKLVIFDLFWFIFFLFRDYTEFLEDLEEDPVLRQNVNVYKGKNQIFNFLEVLFHFFLDEKKLQQPSNNKDDEGEDDLPRIDLNEMLADMTMEDSDKMDS